MPEIIGSLCVKARRLFSREPFFVIMLFLTAALAPFSRPHAAAVHWNVIATLFSLMCVCLAFERCGLLSSAAGFAMGLFKTPAKLGLAMIGVTGLIALLLTNDVALLTVVPLTVVMAKSGGRDPAALIILETLSANLFSALTPFGNPQNLYLYAFYHLSPAAFMARMFPLCLAGVPVLLLLNGILSRGGGTPRPLPFAVRDRRLLAGAGVAFAENILSVLRMLDYRPVLALTLAIFLLLAPRLIARIDFFLLLTFVLFFLFTDSLTGLPAVRAVFSRFLVSPQSVVLVSAGISQVISNVPAAVLLAGFTRHSAALLYGVSAGGLGTPVASLASLISFKLYRRSFPSGRYLPLFFGLNGLLLAVLLAAALFLCAASA